MKLKTWHWVAIVVVVGGLITWAVLASQKRAEEERLEAIRQNQNLSGSSPNGSKLADILKAIFPFFETAADKIPVKP